MNTLIKASRYSALLLILIVFSACAISPKPELTESTLYYLPEQGDRQINRFAPVFLVDDYLVDYNRIGIVRAAAENAPYIDPELPVVYSEQRHFSTDNGDYTNLVYRVHFQEVPDGFSPYFIGAGKNVGLLVVVTLDEQNQPLLFTTVHTCGCYLAIIPTNFLENEAWPEGWRAERQEIYGESLPSSLDFGDEAFDQKRLHVRIRSGDHRVMDVWLNQPDATVQPSTTAFLQPLDDLKRLPVKEEQSTSFYEESGSRTGHVKGSYKSRERLWMSWWAFAWTIGQDKYLGKDKQDGPVFYTSLKPWARDDSDMRDFAKFLQYWGWRL